MIRYARSSLIVYHGFQTGFQSGPKTPGTSAPPERRGAASGLSWYRLPGSPAVPAVRGEQDPLVAAIGADGANGELAAGHRGIDDRAAIRRPGRIVASREPPWVNPICFHHPDIAGQVGARIGALHARPVRDVAAIGRPGRDLLLDVRGDRRVVVRRREPAQVRPIAVHDPDLIPAARPVRGEGDLLTFRRPRRHSIVVRCGGERPLERPVRAHHPDVEVTAGRRQDIMCAYAIVV